MTDEERRAYHHAYYAAHRDELLRKRRERQATLYADPQRREAEKVKKRASARAQYQQHRQRMATDPEYAAAFRESSRSYQTAWQATHPGYGAVQTWLSYHKYREKRLAYAREYGEAHRDEVNARARARYAEKHARGNDPGPVT